MSLLSLLGPSSIAPRVLIVQLCCICLTRVLNSVGLPKRWLCQNRLNSLLHPMHQLVAVHKKRQTANSSCAPPYPPRWTTYIPAHIPVVVLPSGKHLTMLQGPAQMSCLWEALRDISPHHTLGDSQESFFPSLAS